MAPLEQPTKSYEYAVIAVRCVVIQVMSMYSSAAIAPILDIRIL